MKRHEIREMLGGPGSGHHGHVGIPGHQGGSAAGKGGAITGGGITEDTIRQYGMMRHASYVSEEYAAKVMGSAMQGTDGLSAAQQKKVTTHRKLLKIEERRRSDLHKEHAIVVPKRGAFEGLALQVKGYAERVGSVIKWRTSPIGIDRKMLKIEIDIPKEDL